MTITCDTNFNELISSNTIREILIDAYDALNGIILPRMTNLRDKVESEKVKESIINGKRVVAIAGANSYNKYADYYDAFIDFINNTVNVAINREIEELSTLIKAIDEKLIQLRDEYNYYVNEANNNPSTDYSQVLRSINDKINFYEEKKRVAREKIINLEGSYQTSRARTEKANSLSPFDQVEPYSIGLSKPYLEGYQKTHPEQIEVHYYGKVDVKDKSGTIENIPVYYDANEHNVIYYNNESKASSRLFIVKDGEICYLTNNPDTASNDNTTSTKEDTNLRYDISITVEDQENKNGDNVYANSAWTDTLYFKDPAGSIYNVDWSTISRGQESNDKKEDEEK